MNEKRPFHFNRFDDKILKNIFNFLSLDELVEMRYVCTKWQKVIDEMDKNIIFMEASNIYILEILYKFQNSLVSISLNQLPEELSVILNKIKSQQINLRKFYINSCKIISENDYSSMRKMKRFLLNFTTIEVLQIRNTELIMDDLLYVLPQMKSLRSLSIGNNPFLKASDIVSLLLNCETLTSFNLSRFDSLSDQDMRFMFSNPRLTDRLTELTLDRVYTLNEISYELILNCEHLLKLNISYTTGFSAKTLLKIPQKFKNLKSLKLQRLCRITSEDLINLFSTNEMKLNEFIFKDCCTRINNLTLLSLTECLSNTLTYLKLRNCSGISQIGSIYDCKYLKYLDLGGCKNLITEMFLHNKMDRLCLLILPEHLLDDKLQLLQHFDINILFKKNFYSDIEQNCEFSMYKNL